MTTTRNHWQVTHGCAFTGKRTPEFVSWLNMRSRCNWPQHENYALYGGRGIRVCERWNDSFQAFLDDMGPRPTPQHTIDRIDVNGNYEPGNCRWATRAEQGRNTRRNARLTHGGVTLCLREWERRLGLGRNVVAHRIKAGWSVAEALGAPPKAKGPQPCSVADCGRPCKGRGLCNKHYLRRRRREFATSQGEN